MLKISFGVLKKQRAVRMKFNSKKESRKPFLSFGVNSAIINKNIADCIFWVVYNIQKFNRYTFTALPC